MRIIISLFLTISVSTIAGAQADSVASSSNSPSEGKAECKLGKLTRSVVLGPQGNGCKVDYSKEDGSTKTLWSSINDAGYCGEKATGFVQKLTSQGWTCEGSLNQ